MQNPATTNDFLSLKAAGYILGGVAAMMLSIYVNRTARNKIEKIED
jgi:hypothetical protein